jgi:hypothetical protein
MAWTAGLVLASLPALAGAAAPASADDQAPSAAQRPPELAEAVTRGYVGPEAVPVESPAEPTPKKKGRRKKRRRRPR